jgi:hypothetical protein
MQARQKCSINIAMEMEFLPSWKEIKVEKLSRGPDYPFCQV